MIQSIILSAYCHITFVSLKNSIKKLFFKYFFHSGLSNRPKPPAHRKSSLPKHSDVKARFLEICHTTLSEDVKAALRLPSFDSYDWEDYEILHLMETMFIELNFIEKFHISPTRLREWLYEVYKHYNDVPFHNFRHCFCVSQMVSNFFSFALSSFLSFDEVFFSLTM